MPYKPKRPCSFPGCPKLTDGRYCEAHAKQEMARYNKYDRDPASKKRYGKAWKRVRDRYIAAHPLCEVCEAEGRLMLAEEVHHKVPLSRGGTNDYENLQSLCHRCHSTITAKEGDRWGRHRIARQSR